MGIITNPWFYAAAIPAILVTGISKGGFAGGLGILAVPLMSLTMPPKEVAGIMLPILCLVDAISVWAYRRQYDLVNLRILMPSAIIGNLIGTFTFTWFDDRAIGFMVGVIAVVFTLVYWLSRASDKPPTQPSLAKGTFWGTVSGFTSFVSHVGGPPVSVYLLPQRMEKTLYAGTTVMYFAWINFTKLPAYWYLGQLSLPNLTMSLVLAPLAAVGTLLGVWLHGRVNATVFYRIIYTLVFLSGAKLVYEGVVSFLR
ncbi:MAG TPA: sulfite exporter TauE/SafE family protein [bacterium]